MRRSLLAVLVAVGALSSGPIVSVGEAGPGPDLVYSEFPLPADAVAHAEKAAKKSSSRITTYGVPRSREVVVVEARAALKTGKWEIVKDEPSPSGNAVRLTVKKNGKTWKVSFTGDDKQAVIIVTAPA